MTTGICDLSKSRVQHYHSVAADLAIDWYIKSCHGYIVYKWFFWEENLALIVIEIVKKGVASIKATHLAREILGKYLRIGNIRYLFVSRHC